MASPAGGRQPGMPRPRPRGLGAELVPVALVLAALAGSLALVLAMYRRPPAPRKNDAPAPVVVAAPKPAPVVAPPKPAPKPRPPEPEDPTPGALAALASREADERRAAEAADRKAEALERARQAAVSSASRRRRREFAVRARARALEDQARTLEAEAEALAAERDALVRDRELAKDALLRAQSRSQSSLAVLPYKGANGTWRRPIAIECVNGTATLQPTGPTFGMSDLSGLGMVRTNPLAVAVARAYIRVQGSHTPDGAPSVPYVVFVVRPDGIRSYYQALAQLEPLGLAFGYELVEQDAVIEFPDPEAPGDWDDAPAPRAFGPLSRRPGAGPGGGTSFGGGPSTRGLGPGAGPEGSGPDPRALAAIAGGNPAGDGRLPLDIGDEEDRPTIFGNDPEEPGFGPAVRAPRPDSTAVADAGAGDPNAPPRPLNLEALRAGPPRFQADTRATRNDPVLHPVAEPSGPGGGYPTPTTPSQSLPRTGDAPGPAYRPGRTGGGGDGNLRPRAQFAEGGDSNGTAGADGSPAGVGSGGSTGSTSSGRYALAGSGANNGSGRRTASWRAAGGGQVAATDSNGDGQDTTSGAVGRAGVSAAEGGGSNEESGSPGPFAGSANGVRSGQARGTASGSNGLASTSTDGGGSSSGNPNGINVQVGGAGSPTPGGSTSMTTAKGADATGSSSSAFGMPGKAGQESRVAEEKKMQLDHRPLRPLELVVVCDENGLTLYPGAYRLRAATLEAGEGELPRRLRALAEARSKADPTVNWQPHLRFRIEPGGQQTYWNARRQTLVAGVDWPVTIQVADPDRVRGLGTERR